MKALTVCQPYAHLIVTGEKRVENRKWSTPYRGRLIIHAGKSRSWLDTWHPLPEEMVFGAAVGEVAIADCVRAREVPDYIVKNPQYLWLSGHIHVEGPWCWILEDAVKYESPIPMRGQRGMFEVDV